MQRKPTQKGTYEEMRRKQLEKERDKYNADFLGRYKGGLPVKNKENVRRSLKGE